jgi:hypothetical protein
MKIHAAAALLSQVAVTLHECAAPEVLQWFGEAPTKPAIMESNAVTWSWVALKRTSWAYAQCLAPRCVVFVYTQCLETEKSNEVVVGRASVQRGNRTKRIHRILY